jgi:hypothetical protein
VGLWEAFESLPRPSAPGFYTVEPGTHRVRAGRSYENHPAVLIEFIDPHSASTPRRLANLSYAPPTLVDLATRDGTRQARLAVLECRTRDPALGSYFFRVVASMLSDGITLTSELGFESALDALVTLFRSLQRPGVRTVQGLWAELALISWSADAATALSSWHSNTRALHDFAAGSFRLEAKSSLRGLREHTFILDQLVTLPGGATLVASLLLCETEDGASVFDLIEVICARVGPGSAARLETIVADSLGNNWYDAVDVRFSVDGARRSLQLYEAQDIPSIPQPLPPEVKEVRFTVDLSGTPHLELAEARARGPFFRQLLPAVPTQ